MQYSHQPLHLRWHEESSAGMEGTAKEGNRQVTSKDKGIELWLLQHLVH